MIDDEALKKLRNELNEGKIELYSDLKTIADYFYRVKTASDVELDVLTLTWDKSLTNVIKTLCVNVKFLMEKYETYISALESREALEGD